MKRIWWRAVLVELKQMNEKVNELNREVKFLRWLVEVLIELDTVKNELSQRIGMSIEKWDKVLGIEKEKIKVKN